MTQGRARDAEGGLRYRVDTIRVAMQGPTSSEKRIQRLERIAARGAFAGRTQKPPAGSS